MVPIERFFDRFVVSPGVVDGDFIESPFDFENVLGVPLDVGRLSLEAAGRLMDHDLGIG